MRKPKIHRIVVEYLESKTPQECEHIITEKNNELVYIAFSATRAAVAKRKELGAVIAYCEYLNQKESVE